MSFPSTSRTAAIAGRPVAAGSSGPQPRTAVAALPRVVHGAVKDAEIALLARAGIAPDDVLDFSVNSNPLGVSGRVLDAVRRLSPSDVGRYPDDEATELRTALATRFEVSADRVIAANGSSELLWLVCLAYLQPGDSAVIAGPTFGEYERAARIMGAQVHHVTAGPGLQFAPPLDDLRDAVSSHAPRLVFLCNPNNPTGAYLEAATIEALVRTAPGTLWVIDEAYAPFVSGSDGLRACVDLIERPNVLLVRSLTKDHAFAGIRLGYALGAPEVVGALACVKPPWSVSRVAIVAGLAALEDTVHAANGRTVATAAIEYLGSELKALGLRVFPTRTNFMLVDVAPRQASELRLALLQKGLVVRDCASFGLPTVIRIAARPLENCWRLVTALRELIQP